MPKVLVTAPGGAGLDVRLSGPPHGLINPEVWDRRR